MQSYGQLKNRDPLPGGVRVGLNRSNFLYLTLIFALFQQLPESLLQNRMDHFRSYIAKRHQSEPPVLDQGMRDLQTFFADYFIPI